jgi:hypothetical protein
MGFAVVLASSFIIGCAQAEEDATPDPDSGATAISIEQGGAGASAGGGAAGSGGPEVQAPEGGPTAE